VTAALLLLVSAWVLSLAALGATLGWRATAWTIVAGQPSATETGDDAAVTSPAEQAPIG
jgi:hypothetical protein